MSVFERLKEKVCDLSDSIAESTMVGVISDLGEIAAKTTVNAISDLGDALTDKAKDTFYGISESCDKFGDSLSDFYTKQVNSLLSKIDFDSSISKLKEFEKENNTDVSSLIDFLKKMKGLKDGKE